MNNRRRNYWWALTGLSLVGVMGCCDGPGTWKRLEDGRIIPDHWSNALPAVGQVGATYPLDYGVIYMTDPARIKEDFRGSYGGILWLRFWPEGQMHSWWRSTHDFMNQPISAKDAENFTYLGAARYYAQGRQITIEHIAPAEDLFCVFHYFREKGTVNADGSITLFIEDPRGTFNLNFYPKRVGEMKREPNWRAMP